MSITSRQANVMDHAVAYPRFYRNHFRAKNGTENDQTWLELMRLGYAELFQIYTDVTVYKVTDTGIIALEKYHNVG